MKKPGRPKGSKTGSKGMIALPPSINPEEIERMRLQVFNVVRHNIPRVKEVLDGKRKWDGGQIKLYLSLLDKCMPNLSQTYSTVEHVGKGVEELSMDQLTQILATQLAKTTPEEAPPLIESAPPPQYANMAAAIDVVHEPLSPEEQSLLRENLP